MKLLGSYKSKLAPKMTFIYCLIDPRTGLPKYVGKSNNPKARYYAHMCSRKKALRVWIEDLRIEGLRPVLSILEETPFERWEEKECFWINAYKDNGYELLNMTGGGGGLRCHREDVIKHTVARLTKLHKGRKRSRETRERIRQAMLLIGHRPPIWACSKGGRKAGLMKAGSLHTQESKQKMSLAKQGRKFTIKTREKSEFLAWWHNPPPRQPRTQAALARKLLVTDNTISTWVKEVRHETLRSI